jgi:hypothetical protein
MALAMLLIMAAVLQGDERGKGVSPPNEAKIPDSPAEPVKVVAALLNGIEFKEQRQTLIKMGERAFPAFEAILADPESDPGHVARIFVVLMAVDADRRRFLDPTVMRLADPNDDVRSRAVRLLALIGSEKEAPSVVALLSDKEWTNAIAAAKTLAAIGDRRAVAAMDVWLKASGRQADRTEDADAELREYVAKYRDELKQRLDRAEKEKPGK